MEVEAVAVAAEDKGNIKGSRVIEGLLDTRGNGVRVVLCLNNRNGNVRLVVEDVIGPFPTAPSMEFPSDIDATVREFYFSTNLKILIPTGRNDSRGNELRANIALSEGFFVQKNAEGIRLKKCSYDD